MIATTADLLDVQALKEEAREMSKIIKNQDYAIQGLKGELEQL